jgi:hypothetical protein
MERKRFFITIGAGFLGLAIFRSMPFYSLLTRKDDDKKIKISPNPLAVSRKKIGDKNV